MTFLLNTIKKNSGQENFSSTKLQKLQNCKIIGMQDIKLAHIRLREPKFGFNVFRMYDLVKKKCCQIYSRMNSFQQNLESKPRLRVSHGNRFYRVQKVRFRLCLNSSFIDSPRLKVKILTVGKTLFKSKIHQISKF
jgi:hypothetical protein